MTSGTRLGARALAKGGDRGEPPPPMFTHTVALGKITNIVGKFVNFFNKNYNIFYF